MRKSKYLVLSGLYFKFNDDITKIDEIKKSFENCQNILDLLKFEELSIIKFYQFAEHFIDFIYFSNNIKIIDDKSFENNKIKYINFSNCRKLEIVNSNTFVNNNINIVDLSNCNQLELMDYLIVAQPTN